MPTLNTKCAIWFKFCLQPWLETSVTLKSCLYLQSGNLITKIYQCEQKWQLRYFYWQYMYKLKIQSSNVNITTVMAHAASNCVTQRAPWSSTVQQTPGSSCLFLLTQHSVQYYWSPAGINVCLIPGMKIYLYDRDGQKVILPELR